jgi:hypothetical protein
VPFAQAVRPLFIVGGFNFREYCLFLLIKPRLFFLDLREFFGSCQSCHSVALLPLIIISGISSPIGMSNRAENKLSDYCAKRVPCRISSLCASCSANRAALILA